MSWTTTASVVALFGLPSCYGASDTLRDTSAAGSHSDVRSDSPRREVTAIEVLSKTDDVPLGGDGAPRLTLGFRFADGTRAVIGGEAKAYVPFRRGVALVDVEGQLVLVTPEGARSVLARDCPAPPARGASGELVYAARHSGFVEVHTLFADGRDRVVATELGSVGLLAPQRDGRLIFVGTRRGGGVVGVWLAGADGAPTRCLTNCDVRGGTGALGSEFVPLPREAHSIALVGESVSWLAADGTFRSLSLALAVPSLRAAPVNGSAVGGTP
ncbi:MAG: hypothetical protein ACOY0T_00030 [Myxococcota bacterium]